MCLIPLKLYFKTSLGSKLFYKRQARHFLRDAMPKEKQRKDKKSENEEAGERYIAPRVTAADFNHSNHILVTLFHDLTQFSKHFVEF